MAKLSYSVIMSLDGYMADREANFDWAAPDEEVHAADPPSYIRDFAGIWQAAPGW